VPVKIILREYMPAGEKPIAVRIDSRRLKRVDALAGAMKRSRTWVIRSAIDRYLDYEQWFRRKVESALKQADAGDVIEHDTVAKRWERKRETSVDSRRHP
jgi:RHH-type rel operon transcriptional repressor/antitoxin RelB